MNIIISCVVLAVWFIGLSLSDLKPSKAESAQTNMYLNKVCIDGVYYYEQPLGGYNNSIYTPVYYNNKNGRYLAVRECEENK